MIVGDAGTGTLTVNAGTTVTALGPLTIANQAGSTGTVTVYNGGTLALGGLFAGSGNATPLAIESGGTLRFTAGFSTNGAIHFLATGAATGVVIDSNGFNGALSGAMTGNNSLRKIGNGILKLTGANTYGVVNTFYNTTIQGGFIEFSALSNLNLTNNTQGHPAHNVSLDGGGLRWAPGNTTDMSNWFAVSSNGGAFDTNGNDVTFANASGYGGSTFLAATGTITKTGAGTLLLQGLVTNRTGTTVVNGGVLSISTLTNLGTGSVSVATGGELQGLGGLSFNQAATVDGAGSLLTSNTYLEFGSGGTGNLAITNGGTVSAPSTIAAGNTTTGTISVTGAGSTLSAASTIYDGTNGGTGTISVGTGGVVSAGALHFGDSGGSGAFNLNTGGTLKIGGTNTILQGTGGAAFNFAGGTLQVTGSDLVTPLPITLSNASTVNTNGLNATFAGPLSGTGSLTKTGAGTVTLSVANSFSGGFTVNAGTASITAGNQLGTGPVSVTTGGQINGGSANLNLDQGVTVDGASTLLTTTGFLQFGVTALGTLTITNGGAGTAGSSIAFGVSPGTGTGSITGTNSALNVGTILFLGVAGGSGTVSVGAGGTVTAGQIKFGVAGGAGTFNLNSGGTLLIGGGTDAILKDIGSASFNLAGGTLRITGQSFTSSVAMTLSNSSALDTNGFDATLSGALTGAGSLTRIGAGTSGDIFEFSSFTLAGSFTGLTVLNWNNGSTTPADHLVFDTGTFGVSDLAKISFYNSAGQFMGTAREIGYGASAFQFVPEPSSAGLLMAGLTLLGTHRRRRDRAIQI